MNDNKIKILIALKESAGDIFLITATVDSLKKKYPNSSIYIACNKQFWDILEGNPNIKGVLEFHDSMYDYRAYTKWAMRNNTFDIVYAPAVQTQVVPSNWLNGKYAVYLGQFYANACNVPLGKTFIAESPIDKFHLANEYVTVQGQSGQDPKNYDYLQEVVSKIKLPVVQIGGSNDAQLLVTKDLRGKTSFREAATVIKGAKMHLGLDSVLMHFAAHFNVPSIVMFGGTLPQAAINPENNHVHVIETEDRGPCVTSCHLIECEAKKQGYEKCINNIPVDRVIDECTKILGDDYVSGMEPIKVSSYIIIRDGIKYGFPFEESIHAARKVSDEVVVVDGGSTDGTWERIQDLAKIFHQNAVNSGGYIIAEQHEWDMNIPSVIGDNKAYARQLCTGTHLIQLDADEIIHEPYQGAIRDLIKKNRFNDVLDLPEINFYGDNKTIRIENVCWKWHISRNNPNITHGAHKEARQFDPQTGQMIVDRKVSDHCEYIYEDSLEICRHKIAFDPTYIEMHEKVKRNIISDEEYENFLNELIKNSVVVFHYSWLDLNRKQKNAEFWDESWYAKNTWTHNSSTDIKERIEKKNKEKLVQVTFNHPLKIYKND